MPSIWRSLRRFVSNSANTPSMSRTLEPQPPALGLLVRHFQPFPPPDAVHPLHAHLPALVEEQTADAPIAVAAIPGSEPHDRRGQRSFIGTHFRLSTLR